MVFLPEHKCCVVQSVQEDLAAFRRVCLVGGGVHHGCDRICSISASSYRVNDIGWAAEQEAPAAAPDWGRDRVKEQEWVAVVPPRP